MGGPTTDWPLSPLDNIMDSRPERSQNQTAIKHSTALFSASSSTNTSIRTSLSSYDSGSSTSSQHSSSYCMEPGCDMDDSESKDEVDFLELSDEPPTLRSLDKAANLIVHDGEGSSRPFYTLFRGPEHQGQRQLLIFVRHVWCGACQDYLRQLTKTITPSVYFSIPVPTTITVITCGQPAMLKEYKSRTKCPFRIYTDPSCRLYKLFGMPTTFNFGKRPEYVVRPLKKMVLEVAAKIVIAGAQSGYKGATAAGPFWQVGGEFLFEDGVPIWCHRMRTMRGHAEMSVLLKVLGLHDDMSAYKASSSTSSIDRSFTAIQRCPSTAAKSVSSGAHPSGRAKLRVVIDDSGEVPRATLRRDSFHADT